MTNIKAKGFDSPAQLREQLEELEQESPSEDPAATHTAFSPEQEIAELRRVVVELQARLVAIREQTDGTEAPPSWRDLHPWLRIVVAASTSFVLARLAQRLRLGASCAAIVPMLTAQLGRRL